MSPELEREFIRLCTDASGCGPLDVERIFRSLVERLAKETERLDAIENLCELIEVLPKDHEHRGWSINGRAWEPTLREAIDKALAGK